MEQKKHRFSKAQIEQLKLKQEALYQEKEKNSKAIEEARSHGDLSENSEYDAARDEQGKIHESLRILDSILSNYNVIEEKDVNKNVVDILAKVTFTNLATHQTLTCQIVDSAFADILNKMISDDSPIAQALIGHKVGDSVKVNCQNPYFAKILKIEYKF